jgi:hypothetical protein
MGNALHLSPCHLLLQVPDLGMLRRHAIRRGASGRSRHSAICLPVIAPVTQHRGLNTRLSRHLRQWSTTRCQQLIAGSSSPLVTSLPEELTMRCPLFRGQIDLVRRRVESPIDELLQQGASRHPNLASRRSVARGSIDRFQKGEVRSKMRRLGVRIIANDRGKPRALNTATSGR